MNDNENIENKNNVMNNAENNVEKNSKNIVTKDMVMKKLSEVIDPEIGADIVSMNLIKDIQIKNNDIYIKMTLTIPGCPLADMIIADVKYKVSQLPNVKNVDVEIVF